MRILVHIIFNDNVIVNKDLQQQTYVNETVPKAVRAAKAITGKDAIYTWWSLSQFKSDFKGYLNVANLKSTPAFGIQFDGEKKVTFVYGYKSYAELLSYFTNVFRLGIDNSTDTTNQSGGGKDGKVSPADGNGNGNGNGLGVRDCNFLDDILESIGFGTVRQYVYFGAAAYFGFRATGSNNTTNQVINGAAAAGLLYMGLTNPLCNGKKK